MNLAEAIAAFEADFTVHAEVGWPIDGTSRVDMGRAPTGDRYVCVESGGERAEAEQVPGWFATEDLAVAAWLREAWAFAEGQGGRDLYWRERPTLERVEFVAIDQAALVNDPRLRGSVAVSLVTVLSRLFVSYSAERAKALKDFEE